MQIVLKLIFKAGELHVKPEFFANTFSDVIIITLLLPG